MAEMDTLGWRITAQLIRLASDLMGIGNLSLWDQWALTVYGLEAEYPPNIDWISLVTESMPGLE